MPYNPGIAYNGSEALFRGVSAGAQNLAKAAMWLAGEADQTKQLRSTLETVDPQGDYKDLSKSELQGKMVALHLQDQMRTEALNNALKQAQLSNLKDQATSQGAMTAAMRQVMPQTMTMTPSGQPAQPGSPFSVTATGRPTPNALIAAIAANPAAINSPAGRQALNDWMRNATMAQRGAPVFTQGPGNSTWASNPFTGQFQEIAADKINATAAARAAARPPDRKPGSGPVISADGKFYFDEHLQAWKPRPVGKANLFGGDETADDATGAGGGITYTRDKSGNLIRGGQ